MKPEFLKEIEIKKVPENLADKNKAPVKPADKNKAPENPADKLKRIDIFDKDYYDER